MKFSIGQKIGSLKVKSIKNDLGHDLYILKCDCGLFTRMYFEELSNAKNCGQCYRTKIKHIKGRPEMQTELYKKWRKSCFARAKFRCEICGSKRYLEAHHKNAWSIAPLQRYDVKNSACLCRWHHRELHKLFGYNTTEKHWQLFKRMKDKK